MALAWVCGCPSTTLGPATTPEIPVDWGVAPPTMKLDLLTAPAEGGDASRGISLAAQRGECEAQQVWVRSTSEVHDVSLHVTDLSSSGPGSGSAGDPEPAILSRSHWRWLQDGLLMPQ